MYLEIKSIQPTKISAEDQLKFLRDVGRLMAITLPTVGELGAAYAVACNCVSAFYMTRGQISGIARPVQLLRMLSLEEIAELAQFCAERIGDEQGVNASFDGQVRCEK